MNHLLRDKDTGEIVNPQSADFPLSPSDFGEETWDEVFAQHRESDLIDGYEVIYFADGWYVLYTEGSAWEAIYICDGQITDKTQESNAETHKRARDRYVDVVQAIELDTVQSVHGAVATAILSLWKPSASPESVIVCRVR